MKTGHGPEDMRWNEPTDSAQVLRAHFDQLQQNRRGGRLTQRKLASLVNSNRTTVGRWLKVELIPEDSQVESLVEALGGNARDTKHALKLAAAARRDRLIQVPAAPAAVGGENALDSGPNADSDAGQWKQKLGLAPPLADCIQPRPAEMALIIAALEHDSEPEPTLTTADPWALKGTCVLTGLGGVGKSQLATLYHRRWTDKQANGLSLWITAATRSAIVSAYAGAAHALGRPPLSPGNQEDAAAWLVSQLRDSEQPWLIVLDDLNDPVDLRGLWPSGRSGVTIVTTRRTDAVLRSNGRRLITLTQFSGEQAHEYLSAKLKQCEPSACDGIERLARDLQYLPLALAQAADFISNYGETCSGYCDRLAERRTHLSDLFPEDALADAYGETLAATWWLSIDAADSKSPLGLAHPLLELCAHFDPNGFPMELLMLKPARAHVSKRYESSSAPATERDCRDALYNLRRFSLVDLDRSGPTQNVRVHALVQRVTYERIPIQARRPLAWSCADVLLECWLEEAGDPAREQIFRDNAQVLIKTTLDYLAQDATGAHGHGLLLHTARSLGQSGQVHEARRYANMLATQSASILGSDNPTSLSLRAEEARWQQESGDPHGSKVALELLLDQHSRTLGADHDLTLLIRENLAGALGASGDSGGAADSYRKLLPSAIARFGAENGNVHAIEHNLAYWLAKAGRPNDAYHRLRELAPRRERLLGVKHHDVLETRALAARSLAEAGRPHRAVKLLAALLPVQLEVLGEDHPSCLTARHNLAHWQGNVGSYDEAVDSFERLLGDRRRLLGDEHPETLATRENLAHWRGHIEGPQAAVDALEELLADRERVLGPDHPHTLLNLASLTRWRGATGSNSGAARVLEEALPEQIRVLGAANPNTLITRHNLAHHLIEAGEIKRAYSMLRDLLIDQSAVLGNFHPDVMATRHSIARCLGKSGDPAGAVKAIEDFLPDLMQLLGNSHPDVHAIVANLSFWRDQTQKASAQERLNFAPPSRVRKKRKPKRRR